ncbi:MAG: hypothetical protein CMJ64_19775 [Planctomycetaceae bacterium]|nr:hypothetical protein [Planctomycetaceae bacterium]
MAVSEELVLEELKKVIDPELFVNIVDLGLIYEIKFEDVEKTEGEEPEVEQKNIKIDITLTSPMCPAGPQLIGQSKQFVSAMVGVNDVEVKIVLDPPWTPDRMTEDARDQLGIF